MRPKANLPQLNDQYDLSPKSGKRDINVSDSFAMSNVEKFIYFIGYVLGASTGHATGVRKHPDATGVGPSSVGFIMLNQQILTQFICTLDAFENSLYNVTKRK